MSRRAAAWLAWSVCATVLVLFGLTLVLVFLGWSTPLPKGWVPWQGQIITTVGFMGAPVLGGLIASRRPDNLYGWLWLGLGLSAALLQLAGSYAAYALVAEPGSPPAPERSPRCWGWRGGWASFSCLSSCCCSPRGDCRRGAGGQ
jgi:hypothetical protein